MQDGLTGTWWRRWNGGNAGAPVRVERVLSRSDGTRVVVVTSPGETGRESERQLIEPSVFFERFVRDWGAP